MADSSAKSFNLFSEKDRAPNPWPAPSRFASEKITPQVNNRVENHHKNPNSSFSKQGTPKKCCQVTDPTPYNKKKLIPAVQKLMDVGRNDTPKISRDVYYDAYSYGTGRKPAAPPTNFEKFCDSPRGLTRRGISGRSSHVPRGKNHKVAPTRQPTIPPLMASLLEPFEMMTIETRRQVIRDGGVTFEERCTIKFPKNLPPNCHVITHHQK